MLSLHYRAILSEAIIAIATRSVLTQAGVRFNLAESSHGGGKHSDCQQLLANTPMYMPQRMPCPRVQSESLETCECRQAREERGGVMDSTNALMREVPYQIKRAGYP